MSEQKFHTIDASAERLMAAARGQTGIDIIDHEIRETLERFQLSLNTDAKLSLNHSQIKDRQMKITDVKTFPYNGQGFVTHPFSRFIFA